MKTSLSIFPVIIFSILISGCDNTKSKEWYKSHPDEMNERYNQCKSSGQDSQDCKNARQARSELLDENAPVPDLN